MIQFSAPGKTDIRNITIASNRLTAQISLRERGVCLVLLSTLNKDVILKRFVQFEPGQTELALPTGKLAKGQYNLSIIRDNLALNQIFSV